MPVALTIVARQAPTGAVPDNVWLQSADPAVESHRLYDFDVPDCDEGMPPPLVHAGRRDAVRTTDSESAAVGPDGDGRPGERRAAAFR
jgi:hypothetical protein